MATRKKFFQGYRKNMFYYFEPWSKYHIKNKNEWFHLNPRMLLQNTV